MNIHCTSTLPNVIIQWFYSHIKPKRVLKLLQFYTKICERRSRASCADTACVCWGSEMSPVKCCSPLPRVLPNLCCFCLLAVKGHQKTRPCGVWLWIHSFPLGIVKELESSVPWFSLCPVVIQHNPRVMNRLFKPFTVKTFVGWGVMQKVKYFSSH